MPSVLIVDDSELDRRVAGQLLAEDPELELSFATNGREALDRVGESEPDLVVTDLQMPELDGLELVTHLRMHFPRVAVVLMTAHGSELIATQALERGAASYVPKSQLADKLLETVSDILALARANRTYERLIDCSTRTQFEFQLENDPELIGPLVTLVQQMVAGMRLCDTTGQLQIGVALEQALLNAMLHGNLELSALDLKQPAAMRSALIDRQQHRAPYSERRVVTEARLTRDEVRLVVRDEGHGFDVAKWFPQEGVTQGTRRGLVLMRAFMDDVTFNERGTEVTMVKHRQQVQQPAA